MTFETDDAAERVQQLLMSGRPREALDLSRQLCQAAGAGPHDWLLYGCLSADLGDGATATMALEKVIELDVECVEAWFALGKLLVAAGSHAAAVERFEKAAQLQPDNADIWLTLGIACGLANQPAKAERYCRQALTLQPGSAQARFSLASALRAQGKLAEAEAEYEAVLKVEAGAAVAWCELAQTRIALRKFEAAREAAARALALQSNLGDAHYVLGLVAEEFGDLQGAREHLVQAARLMPQSPEVHWRLGQVHMRLDEYPEAAECFQAVLNIDPNTSKVHSAMGVSFYLSKIYGRAENCFRKALALDNDNFEAHVGLAFTLKNLKRTEEYEKHLVEAVRIKPDDGEVRHMLAALRGETTDRAPADYVRSVFDGYADTFDSHLVNSLSYRTPEHLLEIVKEKVAAAPNSLDIIDLGCGTGLCGPHFRGMARTLHGVDLAPRMIDKARERALYDTLEVADVVDALKARAAAWDLALAADVFVYVGALEDFFSTCRAALKPGGYLAFSVEAGDDSETFILRKTGRYAHASGYIRSLAAATGFEEIERRTVVLRKEGTEGMQGYIFLLRLRDDLQPRQV